MKNICRRCGQCCYEKVEFQGQIYYTPTPCEWLDLKSSLCTVYADRQKVRPGCVKLTPRLIARGILPADCPYVAEIESYRPPHLWQDEEDDDIQGADAK